QLKHHQGGGDHGFVLVLFRPWGKHGPPRRIPDPSPPADAFVITDCYDQSRIGIRVMRRLCPLRLPRPSRLQSSGLRCPASVTPPSSRRSCPPRTPPP